MKQSFIVLGEGLTDLFEFNTLIEYNHLRINKIVYFHTPQSSKQLSSVAMIMNPTSGNHFQAMYIMLDALKYPFPNSNKNLNSLIIKQINIMYLYSNRCTTTRSIPHVRPILQVFDKCITTSKLIPPMQ